ncbi:hypothetical protein IFM89_010525 [Coptis chinensis]|uniref:Pre-mRNA-processing factor 39 n=1 Tax=Coptis chinensis TaxID=261450 RepID=A0A835HQ04_9MAGN|nr:hypothetical protein IFM89_010525 [Coptis chinensis]
MGDSETVVAETATGKDYASTGYTPADYNTINSNAVTEDGGAFVTGDLNSVEMTDGGVYAVSDGSTLGDGSAYGSDPNVVMQDAPVTSTYDDTTTVPVVDTTGNPVSQENAAVDSTQAGGYYSSMNGNGVDDVRHIASVGHDVNGTASHDASAAAVELQYDAVPGITLFINDELFVIDLSAIACKSCNILVPVSDNKYILASVEKDSKYAEHEHRLTSVDKVVEVFERAVEGVTYSVDMWLHYCVFAISTYGDQDTVRRLFERGLAFVGTDYLSYPLWDKYIEYEYSHQEWSQLATIYTRILENPNQQLDRYFGSFKELAGSRPLSELRTAEEAAAVTSASLEVTSQGTEGEVCHDGAEHSHSAGAGLTEAEELEKYVAIREEMYKKSKEFDSKIIGFETAIRRPYFHVRPLNGSELENWHNYLDFIERVDDFNKVVKLYERCLIACANYSEFWIRYVLCMEASGSMDSANDALARATQTFVKRQPEIHLFAAKFREQTGNIAGAREAYQHVHSGISPGLLEAIIKHANMEHRLGNTEDAFSLYDQAIATEKGKEQSQTLPMLFVQYARFQYLVAGNLEKAREILDGALEHVELSKPFLEAWMPSPQAQGQQYPGYTQQAAYGGYNSTYVAPQVPVSAPQTAAYSAYPPSYPAQQPYPQQSYAQLQPATAAFAPTQQSAPVSQAYYGSSYY